MRVLFVNPSTMLQEDVQAFCEKIRNFLQQNSEEDVIVRSSMSDLEFRLDHCGYSYETWAHEVSCGLDINDYLPNYTLFWFSQLQMGRAAAIIVDNVLKNPGKKHPKTIVMTDGSDFSTVYQVQSLRSISEENWKSGWEIDESSLIPL